MSGSVSVNGIQLTAGTMQRLCGYVLQDDVLPATSTVQEYLRCEGFPFVPSAGCQGFRTLAAWPAIVCTIQTPEGLTCAFALYLVIC